MTALTVPAAVDRRPSTAGGGWPLIAAAALLVFYPALRPWSDTEPGGG